MVVYMLAMPEISWEALGSSDSLAKRCESYQLLILWQAGQCCSGGICFCDIPQICWKTAQRRQIILRKRYWLYYSLTFIAGARRQIFLVFASFLMVEKFDYSLVQITLLFLVNAGFNIWLAPIVGRIITKVGERAALVFEYLGLIGIFVAYAFVDSAIMAAGLYVLDHLFFAFAMAIKTYFQKIGDRRYGQHGQRCLYH